MTTSNNPDLTLATVNTANQQPIVYIGKTTELAVTLTNNLGVDLALTPGTNASVLQILLPDFYTGDDLSNMKIDLPDWNYKIFAADQYLTLTYAGAAASWANGTSIQFNISNATSNSAAGTDFVQINPTGFGGNIPSQVQTPAPISLINVPSGKAKLLDAMEISVDSQGSIYVSTAGDPIYNKLFLNLKNIGNEPLYSGKQDWPKQPQVIVSFVYGNTSGALAPDNDKKTPEIGSAWKIKTSIPISQNNVWSANPGTDTHPQWILEPSKNSLGIIGTGDSANITFEFSQIVSLTPIGHTQMTVVFKNFMKDYTTPFDDQVFILDIVKQNPSPYRGALNFFGPNPLVKVYNPDQPVKIDLRWTMFDVASINLITSFSGIAPVSKKYDSGIPLQYDNYTILIPGVSQDSVVIITLQAFDGYGGYLNSLQFTVFIQSKVFNDPRDGKIYPTVQIGNQIWLAKNLDYKVVNESLYYNNDGSNEAKFGRLYTWQGAQCNLPPGWRLPTQADWQKIVNEFADAYAALIEGGTNGFDAPLGGWSTAFTNGNFSDKDDVGYFWTATEQDANDAYFVMFSCSRKMVILSNSYPFASMFSVRYVKNE